MSFRVLVVPEDPTYNGYILQPLVEKMMGECGRANAHVHVLPRARVAGYDSAVQLLRTDVPLRYSHFDLVLFLPDADGKDRSSSFFQLESELGSKGMTLFCCAAVQEVETWLLAGHANRLAEGWEMVRQEVDVKETHFIPFSRQHGNSQAAGEGRSELMQITLQGFSGLLARCPELGALCRRISDWLQN